MNQDFTRQYIYDGWLLSATYRVTPGPILTDDGTNSQYQSWQVTPDQSFAWGPDLSGGYGGAGGIGGLAIAVDETTFSPGGGGLGQSGPMFPIYDGNGNVTNVYGLGTGASMGTNVQQVASYEYGPFGEVRSLGLVIFYRAFSPELR